MGRSQSQNVLVVLPATHRRSGPGELQRISEALIYRVFRACTTTDSLLYQNMVIYFLTISASWLWEFSFLKVDLIDYAITVVPISPCVPVCLVSPFPLAVPPYFMSMGHAYKFFGYSISYTVFNIHPPVYSVATNLYPLIPVPYPSFSPFPLPTDNPPNDLHTYDSVSVLLVGIVCFFRFSC